MAVMSYSKRGKLGDRACDRAPKLTKSGRLTLSKEWKTICGFIDMVRFHTLPRCPRAGHVTQWRCVNWGELLLSDLKKNYRIIVIFNYGYIIEHQNY